jgi:hypothetical protein
MPDRLDRLIAKADMLAARDGVAVILVRKDGKCFPEKLIVKARTQTILWATNADDLTIDPIPGLPIVKDGVFCRASPAAPMAETKYSGTVTTAGIATQFDPRLEVVR